MSVGSVQSNNGSFYVVNNGVRQQVDLATLMMMLNLDRTKNLDNQIAVQLSEIQDRNNLIKEMTELLTFCRKLKADGSDDDYWTGTAYLGHSLTIGGVTLPITKSTSTGNIDNWADRLGIEWTNIAGRRPGGSDASKTEWDSKWEINIQNIKSKIDTLNNDSQMDNIKLQNLLEKRGNSFEMATKTMDTDNQTKSSIIRNL